MSHTLFFVQSAVLMFTAILLVTVINMLKAYDETIEATRQALKALKEEIRALDTHWRQLRDYRIGRY